MLKNVNLKNNYSYLYDVNQNKILNEENFSIKNEISYKSFNLQSLQAAFVFEKIDSFLKKVCKQKI